MTSITKAMSEEENSYRAEVASSGYISEMGSSPLWISSNILPSVSSGKGGNRIAHYSNVGPSFGAWNARVSQRSCRDYRDTCFFPNLAIVYQVSITKSLVGNLVLKKYLFSASKEPLDSETQSKLLSHQGQQEARLTKVILSLPNSARAIE